MRKPKTAKPKTFVFMTPAEQRGEAAYIALKLLLARLPQSQVKLIEAEAKLQAEHIGLDDLTNEIECLFPEYELRAH